MKDQLSQGASRQQIDFNPSATLNEATSLNNSQVFDMDAQLIEDEDIERRMHVIKERRQRTASDKGLVQNKKSSKRTSLNMATVEEQMTSEEEIKEPTDDSSKGLAKG